MGEKQSTELEDRRESKLRWLILILCCCSTFGDYYCFDNVGALHDSFKEQFLGLGDSFEYYFGLLYSVYSIPNIILPFFGGILITTLGNRYMYIIFSSFLLLGQLIFALGCSSVSMGIMLTGRFIFGIGGECINICQTAMIVKWFYKSQVALPLGLTITVSRLGSVINDVLSPTIATSNDASAALWTGLMICILSIIACMSVCYLDWQKDNTMSMIEVNQEENSDMACRSVKEMSTLFWLICILCLLLYGIVLPFNYIASGFLTSTSFSSYSKEKAQQKAGIYMGIPFFLGAFLVPALGYLIDNYGQRAYLMFIAALASHLSMIFFYITQPIYPLILLGCTYSLFASVIWPAISLVVKKSIVGLAYGIVTSFQNVGTAIFPMLIAQILSRTNNYYSALSFFVGLSIFSIVISILIIIENRRKNNIINSTEFPENDEDFHNLETRKLMKNEKKNLEDENNSETLDYATVFEMKSKC